MEEAERKWKAEEAERKRKALAEEAAANKGPVKKEPLRRRKGGAAAGTGTEVSEPNSPVSPKKLAKGRAAAKEQAGRKRMGTDKDATGAAAAQARKMAQDA